MTEFRAEGGALESVAPQLSRILRGIYGAPPAQVYPGQYFADGGAPAGMWSWLPRVQHTLQRGLHGIVPGVPAPPSPGLEAFPNINAAPVRNPRPAPPSTVVTGARMAHGGRATFGRTAAETMTRRMPTTGYSGAGGEPMHQLKPRASYRYY